MFWDLFHRSHSPPSYRPAVEPLEDRSLPATFFTSRLELTDPRPAVKAPQRDAAPTVELSAEQKSRADQLISLYENSTPVLQYAYIQNLNDGRGFTAGRAGFTTVTGDLLDVVKRYTAQQPRNPLKRFLRFLRPLARHQSDDTSDLVGLKRAWKKAARDSVFLAVQDQVVDETYYPARRPSLAGTGTADAFEPRGDLRHEHPAR